jgi:hypothetical protein
MARQSKRGRVSWSKRLPVGLRRRMLERIDADAESAKFIFDDLNLTRFCRLSTFYKFVTARQRDQAARRPARSARPVSKPATLSDLMLAAFQALARMTDRGAVRGYALHEVRLLIRDIGVLLEKYGGAVP